LDHLDLAPIRRVRGSVKLPGSKSISNRVLLLAALADDVTVIRDVLESDDTRVMLDALRKLGVDCTDAGDRTARAAYSASSARNWTSVTPAPRSGH
jgi:3-phosphoshikimate 1-carboxyvinyltransferase